LEQTEAAQIQERIESWLNGPYDSSVKEEIRSLQEKNPQALIDAFYRDLSFGTGGMRSLMGVGTNRMNVYTVRAATQGLADALLDEAGPKKVFIGYDVRINSRLFAEETARVLAGNGIEVYLTSEICPTPLVSFGCRYYGCSAAVMITASTPRPREKAAAAATGSAPD
jgi:phosphoglucomutase/phosphomannomutase